MIVYDILSISGKLIEMEDIKEITSSKLFVRPGEPSADGLASYEIFGYPGSIDRRNKYGYINLNDIFVNPHCLFELKSLKHLYLDLVYGRGEFYLKDGDIFLVTEDDQPPAGAPVGSGCNFLFKIWEKLNFEYKDVEPGTRYNRLRFIKSLGKSQVFMDKILVIPPFYRDVDLRQDSNKNETNVFYIKILNLAQTMKTTGSLFSSIDAGGVSDSYRQIVDTLSEYHQKIVHMYGGRKGFIHSYVMGKSIDFSARLVISGLDISEIEKPSNMGVDFTHSRVPLFAIIKCFAPFIINGVRDIILEYLKGSEYVFVNKYKKVGIGDNKIKNKNKLFGNDNIQRVKLADDWKNVLTSTYIYNLIEIYHESPHHRLDTFKLPTEDGGDVDVGFYIDSGEEYDLEEDIASASSKIKPLRLIHLFYMVAYDKLIDKHIYIARYPIEDHNNTYPSSISIIPYKRTKKLTIGDKEYPNFPVVEKTDIDDLSSMFTDSLVIFPIFLSALDGDFDGDMVSIIGVFTKEANNDAKKHLTSIGNMCSIDGTCTRMAGTLAQQVIYGLTYGNG